MIEGQSQTGSMSNGVHKKVFWYAGGQKKSQTVCEKSSFKVKSWLTTDDSALEKLRCLSAGGAKKLGDVFNCFCSTVLLKLLNLKDGGWVWSVATNTPWECITCHDAIIDKFLYVASDTLFMCQILEQSRQCFCSYCFIRLGDTHFWCLSGYLPICLCLW